MGAPGWFLTFQVSRRSCWGGNVPKGGSPSAANVSLRSALSMKPSRFWSMMVKAWEQRRRAGGHHPAREQSCPLPPGVMALVPCTPYTLTKTLSVTSTKSTYLFEFLDLGLLEHGEDVGISTFNPLLGFLGCLRGSSTSQELAAFLWCGIKA